jgi:SagB-type dehydrogenase family enzyme
MEEKPFSFVYHENSKIVRREIPSDDSLWPKEWKTVYYKVYPRFEKIPLPKGSIELPLQDALHNRRSDRAFEGRGVSLQNLGLLLQHSLGIRNHPQAGVSRTHPSGGGRYPIETYVCVFKAGEGLKRGVYHYDVKDHTLTMLPGEVPEIGGEQRFFNYEFSQRASVGLMFTAIFERTYMKYGERSYRFILLEAGHISQNVYLVSQALKLRCTAMGGARGGDDSVEKILDIDGYSESLVHIMLLD